MATTNNLTVTVSVTGSGYGGQGPFYSQTFTNASGTPPGSIATANGFVAVPIPATALGVVVVPPAGSALVKTYKGVTGDTGIPTDPVGIAIFKWTAAQLATFGVLSTGVETLELIWL